MNAKTRVTLFPPLIYQKPRVILITLAERDYKYAAQKVEMFMVYANVGISQRCWFAKIQAMMTTRFG